MESTGAVTAGVATTPKVSSVHLTLPLSCQVCLGKVKDPVICTNQHVFCANCMSQWLEISKSNMCPTCRVPVTDKQPCKRIIGSMEVSPTVKDKSLKEQMRRTRFEILFQEFEKEISTLERRLEEFQEENKQIKEINADLKTRLDKSESRNAAQGAQQGNKNGEMVPQDIGTILNLSTRLQDVIKFSTELKEENKTLKKQLQDVNRENENLKEEVDKLVNSNNYNSSPRKFSRYVVAALEAKVDVYEREITQLKRALERSDLYIEELKQEQAIYSRQIQNADNGPKRIIDRSYASSQSCYDELPILRERSPNSVIQTSKIDELASVALATRLAEFSSSSNHIDDRNSPGQSNNAYSTTNGITSHPGPSSLEYQSPDNVDLPPSSTVRSIFEDPAKFPACAKLIELTKVRRDLAEGQPADIVPLDSPSGGSQNGETYSPGNFKGSNAIDVGDRNSSSSSGFSVTGISHSQSTNVRSSPRILYKTGSYEATTTTTPTSDLGPSTSDIHSQTEFQGSFAQSPKSPKLASYPHEILPSRNLSFIASQDMPHHSMHNSIGQTCIPTKKIKIEEPE